MKSVYSAVPADSLYKADYASSRKRLMPYCLSLFSTNIHVIFHISFIVSYIILRARTSLKSSWISGGFIIVVCFLILFRNSYI